MTLRGAALLLVGTAAALACSGIRVTSDYDASADFSRLETYAWIPDPRQRTGDPRIDNPLLDSRIKQAVRSSLDAKGYRELEEATPDFWVAYHLGVDRKVDVDTIYRSYGRVGWRGGGYADTVVREYEEGTLLLDVIRPNDGALLWRGSAQARLAEHRTPEQRTERVQKVVDEILERFPPTS